MVFSIWGIHRETKARLGYTVRMARRNLEERNTRKLYKNSGGTILVSVPIELIRELKWRDGQKVVVKKRRKGLLIEDWRK